MSAVARGRPSIVRQSEAASISVRICPNSDSEQKVGGYALLGTTRRLGDKNRREAIDGKSS